MCAFFAKLLNVPTEPPAKEFRDPVFLVGAMRSGTTLLMNTLSEHPQLLKVGFELNKVWTEIGGAPIRSGCLERTEDDLKMEFSNNMTAYLTDYLSKSKSFLRHLARISQRNIFGSGGVFYDWDNVFLLNKNPHLSNKVRYLDGMFPKSKFIVIVRSPFGQCASLKMFFDKSHRQDGRYKYLPEEEGSCWLNVPKEEVHKYDKKRLIPGNSELLAEAWLNINYTMFKHLEKIPAERKVIISYEELMNNRPESIKNIFDKLNLKTDYQNVVNRIIEKERKIHNTSTSGNPLEKWKKHLTDDEKEKMETIIKKNEEKITFIRNKTPGSENFWN